MVEYGADGQSYCSSCAFYGLNKQCYRCRMYLPAAELQQYRGQWMCPYCVQDMRDEDRRAQEPHEAEKKPHLEVISYPEQCERCGRDLKGRVYILNDKKLCKNCVEDEKEKWGTVGGGPMAAPYRITLGPEKKRKKTSIIESALSEVLHVLGIRRRKEVEIVVVGGRMPIERARPMAEMPIIGLKKDKESRKPQAEGIMAIAKKEERKAAGPSSRGGGEAPAAPEAAPASELSRVVPAKAMKKRRGKGKPGSVSGAPSPMQKKKQ
jgi:bifunctional DNA-binding transcriptional regulator/antitoxin component of YhaV-PrlF toxin-antitoxin module